MADEPENPPAASGDKPASRRRAPRKTSAPGATKTPTVRKRVTDAVAAAEDAVTKPAEAVADAAKGAAKSAAKAVKPRSTKRAPAARSGTPKKKPTGKAAAGKSVVGRATEKVGGKWGAAAIAGGLAAAGAAAAALLSLKGSTPKGDKPKGDKPNGNGAHQPDGTDSSKSFNAGIADEGTIPE